MKSARIILSILVFLSLSAFAGDTMKVQFGSGKMVVELPYYGNQPKITEHGFHLVLDKKGRYILEMTRMDTGEDMPDGFGVYAVQKMADGQNLNASPVGNKLIIQEPFVQRGDGVDGVKTINFSIGVGKSVVTMTLTTPPTEIVNSENMSGKVNSVVNSAVTTVQEI